MNRKSVIEKAIRSAQAQLKEHLNSNNKEAMLEASKLLNSLQGAYKAELSLSDKLVKLSNSRFSMPVPPVLTTYWTTKDWVNYIDKNGAWKL